MQIKSLDMIVLDAYKRYGQKFYIVLSTAIKIAKVNKIRGTESPGDFEYRSLVEELEKQNFKYNPSMLLRTLEREYGIIETTYRTSNQHWYRFRYYVEDLERTLNSIMGITLDTEEPDVAMLRIQIKSLQINYWTNKLKHISIKENLSSADVKMFQRFAFNVLPKVIKILKKAEEYEDQMYAEINLLKELIGLASIVADRIDVKMDGLKRDLTMNTYFELTTNQNNFQ